MPFFLPLLFLTIVSSAAACDRCLHQAKAAFYQVESDGELRGACGYGNLTSELSNGHFSAITATLYGHGAGCGACFQVRCKNEALCNKEGTKIVVTDGNESSQTDLVISKKAFGEMALSGKEELLIIEGVVDVEFKRVPCEYKNKNLMVRVEEMSKPPTYLAMKLLYQGGQTEIVGIDIAKVGESNWGMMARNYGAVWDTKHPVSEGPLQLRFVVTSGFDGKWIWSKYVFPADWRPGQVYDTGVQMDDVGKENCPDDQCADKHWAGVGA
ncbi:expansin-like A2 [Cucurbita pepo subsp. pepo]|uniref:expansin-like A2 n=1 Tax=Cucurbita pepo subsp. pepo TaxID=3664 RepID=UPI000C9D4611|nr:expansin-like A2 [Cucurbita pepo subsp. pepo]